MIDSYALHTHLGAIEPGVAGEGAILFDGCNGGGCQVRYIEGGYLEIKIE